MAAGLTGWEYRSDRSCKSRTRKNCDSVGSFSFELRMLIVKFYKLYYVRIDGPRGGVNWAFFKFLR